ncbi:variable surface protein [Plasmodium gonderi]|uniref:Variable surface protein n=1 Tax=Plasmodium gonderi TaxID=77519 RepID=A0A1Y1JA61_PLAGO|nr:variable surface protein [Plasmodium gonderi]GAW79401.1 variable surface protein [Plasmodium gonderi]
MTRNKIYVLLGKFGEYEQKMNQCKEQNPGRASNDDICDSFDTDIFGGTNKTPLKGKCPQIFCYLKSILNEDKTRFSELGCKYLNYWLYKDVLNRKYINGILGFYQTLIGRLKNVFDDQIVAHARGKYIQDDNLAKITAIADMKACLDIKKSNGKYSVYHQFCEELEEFIHLYNIETNTEGSINAASLKVPRCKTNTSASTIIPTIIILLIPTLLFILYNVNQDFSPYDSRFRRAITKIIEKWQNINTKERGIVQQSDISNSFSCDSRYYMLYNST